ncbi:MAG: methylated-DNA--[protein]-cysteine S-methyltransferase [Roseiflexus sp.]
MDHPRTITATIAPCMLGYLLVAATERGICAVALGDEPHILQDDLEHRFGATGITYTGHGSNNWTDMIFRYLNGVQQNLDLPLDVTATPFQRAVWSALRTIPYGTTQTYQEVAQRAGRPSAVRAVAQACAGNPVALIIPCHRVVRADGVLGGYRWGIERKRALPAHEAAHLQLCAS